MATNICISDNLRIEREDIELNDLLGVGSFGAVYKGIWKPTGLIVAIKQVRVQGEECTQDLLCELNTMASLSSPHVCKVFGGVLVSETEIWLVLEYLPGGSLHDFLRSRAPLSANAKLAFALSATLAINYLHTRAPPLLHRDIKSHNFLIKNGSELVLTDFGLAKTKDAVSKHTATIGTLNWASPEVLKEEPEWSEKADIYSLGMVFYEITSREIPYKTDTNLFTLHKKIKNGVLPPIPSDCPSVFAELIHRCWRKDPTQRPTSKELVEILTGFQPLCSPSASDAPQTPRRQPNFLSFKSLSHSLLDIQCSSLSTSIPTPLSAPSSPLYSPTSPHSPHSPLYSPTSPHPPPYSPTSAQPPSPLSLNVQYSPLDSPTSPLPISPFHTSSLHSSPSPSHDPLAHSMLVLPPRTSSSPLPKIPPSSISSRIARSGSAPSLPMLAMYPPSKSYDQPIKPPTPRSPLCKAAARGDVATLHELVATGLDLDAPTEEFGRTALHLAAVYGQAHAAKELVKLGHADLNVTDESGETPLHLACQRGHTETVRELIKLGAHVDGKGAVMRTPLHAASEEGHTQVVCELLRSGAQVDALDETWNTPLHWASEGGHREVVKELVGAKANIKVSNHLGLTPLHLAAKKGNTETCQILVRLGAPPNVLCAHGGTPLHLAAERGHCETVQGLIVVGAEVAPVNKLGKTPIQLAMSRGHEEVVKVLQRWGEIFPTKAT